MQKDNVWMSVSDLMTGLMVIFLFIAIAYISQVQDQTLNIREYAEVKQKLHDKLINEFKADTATWKMTIAGDLSLKFKNATTLFPQGQSNLTPQFQKILDKFLPHYFDILLHDSLRNHIVEIRIEGHTDDVPYPQKDPDPYIANVILSQERSLSVLRYFRSLPCYANYSEEEKKLLEYWFTANGLSYGKSLNTDGNYTYGGDKPIDREKSRRVEFRIITDSDKLIDIYIKKNNQTAPQ